MSSVTEAPRQYKQSSRKGKRAWRKNVDISDVQRGLEEIREEEIHGGIVSTLDSAALFTTDTTGSASIQRSYNKANKPLKSDEILALRSTVPALTGRKRASTTTTLAEEAAARKRARMQQWVPKKELERLQGIAYGGGRGDSKHVADTRESATSDLWVDDVPEAEEAEVIEDPTFDHLAVKKALRMPDTLRQRPIARTASGKGPSAVRRPHGGKSYNPVFEEWDRLLVREGEKEVAAETRRLDAEDALNAREERAAQVAEEIEHVEALRRKKEEDEGDDSEWEGMQSGAEDTGLSLNKPVQVKRKTQSDKNRKVRRKREEAIKAERKKRQHLREQGYKIKDIVGMLDQKQEQAQQLSTDVLASDEASSSGDDDDDDLDLALRRRNARKTLVPPAPVEVVLPDELRESLRLLKPEGDLLKDRYRYMVLSGKVEARNRVGQMKKPRRSVTEKWSYKDWKLV